ncbi:GyrI-like domain-containing protein [Lentisphaerota bacterium WC36G]|nr:GyrI-like domain-containing protein [Lentisphaerae bacterium WC36]
MKKIEIKELTGMKYIAIKKYIPVYKMPFFFKKSFKILQNTIKDISADNKFFARYSNIDWDTVECQKGFLGALKGIFKKFDIEVAISFAEKPDNLESSIICSEFETVPKSLQCVHVGPYHKIADTYKIMMEFAQQNNLIIENETFEIYLNDPKIVKAENLETLVILPLK